jgi:tetratricopeptide (TPR) repeat protein
MKQGDCAAARSLYEQSLAIFREFEIVEMIAMALSDLGNVTSAQGDYPAARSFYEQGLAIFRESGNRGAAAVGLNSLGNVAVAEGDAARARSLYEQSLEIALELGNKPIIARLLGGFAGLAAAQGRPQRAFRLAGAAAALRKALGEPLPPEEQSRLERSLEPARQAVPEAVAAAAWAKGAAMSLQEATDDAQERKEFGEDATLSGRPLQRSPTGGRTQ